MLSDSKPLVDIEVQLTGKNGNAFLIIANVSRAIKQSNKSELAEQFKTEAFACGSYDDLLQLCMKYDNVV